MTTDYVRVRVICNDEVLIFIEDSKQRLPSGNTFYTLPGGKKEDKETPVKAALRELQEEAGIQADNISLVTQLGYFTELNPDKMMISYFYDVIITPEQKEKAEYEKGHQALWIPRQKLCEYLPYLKSREHLFS